MKEVESCLSLNLELALLLFPTVLDEPEPNEDFLKIRHKNIIMQSTDALKPGLNFINILRAAFAPVGLRQ